jgi:hypothetical protein
MMLPIGLLLLQQLFFARYPQLSVDRTELQQQRDVVGFGRCYGAVKAQGLPIRAWHLDVLAGVAPVELESVVQRGVERGRLAEQLVQRHADELAMADGEEVLCAGVEIVDDAAFVGEYDGR